MFGRDRGRLDGHDARARQARRTRRADLRRGRTRRARRAAAGERGLRLDGGRRAAQRDRGRHGSCAMKVFVAMSGGVDSSVAAAILKEQGHDVVGVWMRLAPAGDTGPRCCGTFEAGDDARRAAGTLDLPFYALNYEDVFGRNVVDRFVATYAEGETPNPCVACN